MQKVLLLDMDGTITHPRKKISSEMLNCLSELNSSFRVGIVSGSDIDFIMDQCGKEFELQNLFHIDILPCNGTKFYQIKDGKYQKLSSKNIRSELGDYEFNHLVNSIFISQREVSKLFSIQARGEFLSVRDGSINWSIIGRGSGDKERTKFVAKGFNNLVRTKAISFFVKNTIQDVFDKIDIVLGGQTGLDIYPKGWGKDFALNHYPNSDISFIGDKCKPGENDFPIYKLLYDSKKAFEVSSLDETINIIKSL